MALHIYTSDLLESRIGEKVYDPYGRILGRLVGFDADPDGTVRKIFVETDDKKVRSYREGMFIIRDARVEVKPEWKFTAEKIMVEYQRVSKRIAALEEMKSRGEIGVEALYKKMKERLESIFAQLKRDMEKVRRDMKRRLEELEDELLVVENAIINLKMLYMSGEISEKSYKDAISPLRSAKDAIAKEKEDIEKTLDQLKRIEEGAYKVLRRREEETKTTNENPANIPGLTDIPPVVKVVDG